MAARNVVITAIAFVLGFSTVFVALGASASLIGELLIDHFSTLSYVAGALILLLGIHYLGLIRIPLLSREARFQTASRPLGLASAYVVGLAFAFGWTPCVGPVLAAILLYAGSEADVTQGAMLLFVYSLGIGLPFVAVAFFAGPFLRLMQKYRRHIGTVEKGHWRAAGDYRPVVPDQFYVNYCLSDVGMVSRHLEHLGRCQKKGD